MADCFSQQTPRKSLTCDDLPSWLYGPAFWPLISRAMSLISLTLNKISTKLDDFSFHAGVCTRALLCTSGCSRGCKSLRIVTKHWLWRLWAWPPGEFANSGEAGIRSPALHTTYYSEGTRCPRSKHLGTGPALPRPSFTEKNSINTQGPSLADDGGVEPTHLNRTTAAGWSSLHPGSETKSDGCSLV